MRQHLVISPAKKIVEKTDARGYNRSVMKFMKKNAGDIKCQIPLFIRQGIRPAAAFTPPQSDTVHLLEGQIYAYAADTIHGRLAVVITNLKDIGPSSIDRYDSCHSDSQGQRLPHFPYPHLVFPTSPSSSSCPPTPFSYTAFSASSSSSLSPVL